jgi:hypothetical protein
MTSHVARLYALGATLAVFFVSWAVIAAHPWQPSAATAQDPRLARLLVREQELHRQALAVRTIVRKRWAAYDAVLERRRRENAAIRREVTPVAAPAPAPQVRVVTIPAATGTRSS